jgi:glutamate racemase
MTGVFDSGDGGLIALSELRRQRPSIDICFFADRKNAPYGTKSEAELIRLVKKDSARLIAAGADKILMACCTASTVYRYLPEDLQKILIPIIAPTAKEAARVTGCGKVAVIATAATVRSRAFSRELFTDKKIKEVTEVETQGIVSMVESGVKDGKVGTNERKEIFKMLAPVRLSGADTLILGCTHFQHLLREISCMLPGVSVVSAAREGAKEMARITENSGKGRTVYL